MGQPPERCATVTVAGRSWCPGAPYPGRSTCATAPGATPASPGSTTPTTSWRVGSNGTPGSSSRRKPSPATTASACSRSAWTPSTIDRGSAPACSSARSMLSRIGRKAEVTFSRSVCRSRSSSRAYRLRRLSRSARARRQRSSSWATSGPSGEAPAGLPDDSTSSLGGGPVIAVSSDTGAPGSGGGPVPVLVDVFVACSVIGGSAPVELGVDDVVLGVGRPAAGAGPGGGRLPSPWLRGHEPGEDLLELVGQVAHPVHRGLVLHGLTGVGDEHLGTGTLVRRRCVAEFVQSALHLVGERVELVARVDLLAQLLIGCPVALGLLHHALDLGLVEVGALGDGDALLRPGVLVPGGDVEDAVGVDVEDDLDLRLPAGGRPDAGELEPAEHAVVGGPLALALQHYDVDGGLVVGGRREGLAAAHGDGRVPLDDLRHQAALGLHAQRQRGHVEQQDVGDLA